MAAFKTTVACGLSAGNHGSRAALLMILVIGALSFATVDILAQPTVTRNVGGTSTTTLQLGSTSAKKAQQLYTPSDLTGEVGGTINTIYFMYNSTAAQSFTDLTIKLGQTPDTAFTTTFRTGLTQVFSGAVTIPAGTSGNWFALALSTPFTYNAALSLIVETSWETNPTSTAWAVRVGTVDPTGTNRKVYSSTTAALTGTLTTSRANFGFNVTTANMTYASSTVMQATTIPVMPGSVDQQVIGIQVVMDGALNPVNLTQLSLNTNGTTSPADLANAKVYYTGPLSTFSTSTQFGSTVVSPSGSYNVTGTQQLNIGTNYFWLTYDIQGSPTEYNIVDGECTSVTIAGSPQTPSVTAPAGNRVIRYALTGVKTIAAAGTYTSFASAIAELNILGPGTGGVTFTVSDGQTFNESPLRITASGTSANPVVFQRSNTLATSGTIPILNVTGTSATTDAAVRLLNSDYVTFNGIDVRNAGTSAADWVEFGFHLVDSTGADGCQNNTVKNCIVTLDIASNDGKGVYLFSTASGPAGLNSGNHFLNNTIQSAHNGYYFDGQGTGNMDDGNMIGTEGGGTSTITNYGGGTSVAYGAYSIYQSNLTVFNTTVSNGTANGTAVLYGIYFSNASGAVDSCVVTGLAGGGAVYGLYMASGATHDLRKNRVYNLSSSTATTAVMYGIYASSSTTGNIYNNMVYDVRGPSSTSTTGIIGIYPIGGAGATMNVFYNTVYLDYVAVAAANTSSALYVGTSLLVNIRNNIFVNKSDMTAGTRAVAFRKSSTSYTNLASNNNLFYAGTPGPKNLIFYDGTNSDETLAAYKLRLSPNDQSSVTENPPFISTVSPYNLHLSTVDSTAAESGGQIITSPIAVDDDFDANPRFGSPGYAGTGSAPDLGADEFDGVGPDLVGPGISYTTLGAAPVVASVPFSVVTISDPSGVNTGAGTRPRMYYKKSIDANTYAGNTSGDNGWKYVEATGSGPFAFTVDHSLLFGGGSVVRGDVIQYFVVAQDMALQPNIGVNSATFALPPTSVDLSAANFPAGGTINSYSIRPSNSGTYTIGGVDASVTVKEFFDSLNVGVYTGNVTANIVGSTTEIATAILTQVPEFPLGSNFTVTLQPVGNQTISGNIAGAVIKLEGADRVTIDGLNTGGNSLGISNTAVAGASAAVWVSSLGSNLGATDNTIKNCAISAGSNNITTAFGIIASGTTISAGTGADNDNLTIQNNAISRAYYGIYAAGTTTRHLDNLVISGNTIGNNDTAQTVRFHGIDIASAEGALVTQNTIFNIEIASAVDIAGIDIGTTCLNSVISRNRIHRVYNRNTTGNGAHGITVTSTVSNNDIMIVNNVIYDIRSDGAAASTTDNPYGIRLAGGTNMKVYYNSVSMFGTFFNTTTSDISAALMVTTASVTNLDLRNNVFSNSMTGGAAAKAYAIYGASGVTYGTSDNNDYFASGANAVFGYNGAEVPDLTAWRAFTGQDLASIGSNPMFNAPDNLAPALGSPLLSAGVSIGGVTLDFLGVTRGTPPTIGAFEQSGDFQPPAISYSLLGNSSSTTTRSFTSVLVTDLAGVNTTAGTRPRVYYKRSTDANTYADNTNATNGWKYAEANGGGGSPFSFTIDYSRLFGGTVTAGTQVQYFVVAQDLVVPPNVGITTGTFAVQPSSVALTSAAFPIGGTVNAYYISTTLTGVISVGTGQTYTSLTGSAGFFHGLNINSVGGNLTIDIVSNLVEDGTVALSPWAEEGAGNYTVTIRPSAATERLITGDVATSMIRLDGADRVTIDGRSGGSGRYLRFRNANATNPTFLFINDATNNTIRNCYIEGGNTGSASGVVVFSTGVTTGNDSNTLTENILRDRTDVAGVPANLFYSFGSAPAAPRSVTGPTVSASIDKQEVSSTASVDRSEEIVVDEPVAAGAADANSDNTLSNNDFNNFTARGLYITSTGNGDNWVITGNNFYDSQPSGATAAQTALSIVSRGGGNTVANNIIGGSEPAASGNPWLTTGANAFIGIEANVDTTISSELSGNVIQNINRTSTGSATFNGISVTGGSVTIDSNTVGHNSLAASITNAGSSTTHGISVTGSAYNTPVALTNNTIANISATGTGTGVRVRGINFTAGIEFGILNNSIHSLATNSTGTGIAAGSQAAAGIHLWPGSVFYQGDVSGNTIYDIAANNTTAIGSVATGMMLTNFQGLASRNRIYDIRNLSTGTSLTLPPIASGVHMRFIDALVFANNMIAVGSDQTTNTQFNGVFNVIGDAGNDVTLVYNSISVAGAAASGDIPSFAFMRGDNTGFTPHTATILGNNILSNTRSGGTGKHYAVANQGTVPNDTGWSATASNYNVLHAGTAATVGLWGSTDQTFAGWQTASGGDANSVTGDPLFVGTTDLHITNAASPASNAGLAVAITTDFDGDTRSATPDIGADEFTSGGGTIVLGVPVTINWNIVSLPVSSPLPDDSVKHIFTNSINPYAFAFAGGYQQRYTLANGLGYWIKSSATYTQDITGTQRDTLTVPVNNAWNMIGSISTVIDTSAAHVTPSVPGLRGSNYFRYSAGYVVATTISPGLGYWVKANSAGSFFMHATSASKSVAGAQSGRTHEDLNSITIQDANGGSQTLYFGADGRGEIPVAMFAMPPSPPVGAFDARFASADGGTMVQTHGEEVSEVLDLPISIQSMAYPLTVSWKVANGAYELSDGAATHPMRGEGTVKITNSSIEQIVLKVTGGSGLPKEFALSQNYPNPFNPTTSVKYALPVDSRVTMEIYNVIGQRVRTLVNDNQAAGYHAAEWNGKNNAGQQLSSGMYFLQLSARGTNGKSFNEVRKLMLLK